MHVACGCADRRLHWDALAGGYRHVHISILQADAQAAQAATMTVAPHELKVGAAEGSAPAAQCLDFF